MILQICPSDYPPFADLCAVYEQALQQLGFKVKTIFLQAPHAEAVRDATYLNHKQLRATRVMAKQIAKAADLADVTMCVCHRYRAGRVAAALKQRRVVVAHEFGFFRTRRRKWSARLESGATYAGVSPAVVDELSATIPGATLLSNAIDRQELDTQRLARREARAALGLPNDGLLVGWVGRLHRKKRPQLALDAVNSVGEPVTLVMLGEGDWQPVGDVSRLQRCGFVADARRYFSAFDALLMTPSSVEAFGMTALEALCCGVPVVSPDAPGPRHVLGELGCYYERDQPAAVASALSLALNLERDGYAKQAIERVDAQFSINALAQNLGRIVRGVN